MDRNIEWAQRIAILELKVQDISGDLKAIDIKLDSLLELRHRGMGAFWLASSLIGTGLVGIVLKLTGWLKGII